MVERTSPPDPDPSVLWGAIAVDVSHEYPGTLSSLCETCAFSETFIELAGMLVAEFDLMDLLHLLAERCARLVGAAEVGLLLVGAGGDLQVVASSSRRMHNLELFEVQHTEGPCLDVLRSGQAVVNAPIPGNTRWPLFAAEAHAAGYKTVHALPMRHNGRVIGVVNLFDDKSAMLDKTRIRVVQALADIASFAVLQTRALDEATSLTSQLQHALKSRIVIEQAKGVLSDRLGIDVAQAFDLLRGYSRSTNTRLTQVASKVVERRLGADEVLAGAGGGDRRRIPRPGPNE